MFSLKPFFNIMGTFASKKIYIEYEVNYSKIFIDLKKKNQFCLPFILRVLHVVVL